MIRMATPLLTLALWACTSSPGPSFTLESPPLIRTSVFRAGVVDGRARFREIFREVCRARGILRDDDADATRFLWRFTEEPDGTGARVDLGPLRPKIRLIVVPGLLNDAVASRVTPFSRARIELEDIGLRSDLILVSGRSSNERNARQIRDELAALDFQPDERVVALGHSKGSVDLLTAIVLYPEVRERLDAVVAVAGAVGGSPIADTMPGVLKRVFREMTLADSPPGDAGALQALEPSRRQLWLARNPLPGDVSYFTLGAFVERENASALLQPFHDELAAADPRNDGQVIFYDQVIPAGTLLGFARADHWAVVLPIQEEWSAVARTLADRNDYPRTALLEAILRYVAEALGGAT